MILSRQAALRLGVAAGLAWPGAALTAQDAAPRWRLVAPRSLTATGKLLDRALAEASGAAASVANPGLIWTIADSGNPPNLMAIDTSGALRAVLHLAGVANVDWEAVAVGRCGERRCVYIADVGDNFERRSEVVLHRLIEPVITTSRSTIPADRIESLRVRYPDRPRDVEAVAVTPEGDVLMVSKGRGGAVVEFVVPAAAWRGRQPAIARLLDTLPIAANAGIGRLVTDMALSPDGRRAVIRSYRELFFFTRRDDNRLLPTDWAACDILGVEPQGEGVTWLDGARTLLLSERGLFSAGTVHVADCRVD